jgi:hypothetical protein
MNVRATCLPLREARIYVGAREGYDGPEVTWERLSRAVADYQGSACASERGCVRVLPAMFHFRDYMEGGYEVGIVDYPRFPIAEGVERFARKLAEHLLLTLNQNRVGYALTDPVWGNKFVLLEREGAQENPAGMEWGVKK